MSSIQKQKSCFKKIIVSACLAGMPCGYDGRGRPAPEGIELVKAGKAVPVCPEQLGGLATPREPAEIAGGDGAGVLDGNASVLSRSGTDLTEAFRLGAGRVLDIARQHDCRRALLKSGSPSCGAGRIYDGTFTGTLKPGDGVTAALLSRSGIEIEVV